MKKFKVLFVYPNQTLLGVIPLNVALLSAHLKRAGFESKLFDASIYQTVKKTQDQIRAETNQVKKTNIEQYLKCRDEDVHLAFRKMVSDYHPDLIAMTLVDSTVSLGFKLLDQILDIKTPVIIGGVAVTFNYENLIRHPKVDIACIGEGERSLVELCRKMQQGKDYSTIKNLCFKHKKRYHR